MFDGSFEIISGVKRTSIEQGVLHAGGMEIKVLHSGSIWMPVELVDFPGTEE